MALGVRCPCSQYLTVRVDTPTAAASADCERPRDRRSVRNRLGLLGGEVVAVYFMAKNLFFKNRYIKIDLLSLGRASLSRWFSRRG